MKISEIVDRLKRYQKDFGDIEVFIDSDDGYSSWVSSFNPKIEKRQINGWTKHMISHDGY